MWCGVMWYAGCGKEVELDVCDVEAWRRGVDREERRGEESGERRVGDGAWMSC